ncbi:hypothetical protein TH60_17755 [Pantoea ananatis]|uniref:hypothetical protein n=1 Tax=Pantoea ananas TaxID=553 RepID=UPI00234FCF14|nr:hypothetical protein [Pantoea ananatis]MDC7871338.1 hypothetical protein [Pantoea ananatis]
MNEDKKTSGNGREESVKEYFDRIFRSACDHYGKIDILAHLNGLDKRFNADSLYSNFEKFFLIEFKSYKRNIKDELKKPAVCLLCCGLSSNDEITTLHDSCHFLMWGKKLRDEGLEADYDIYRNVVCNTIILPDCKGAKDMKLFPEKKTSRLLAYHAGNNSVGLNATEFKVYLDWLLNSRDPSDESESYQDNKTNIKKDDEDTFFSTIYATSEKYAIDITFNSIESLYQWAMSDKPKPKPRNDDWSKFKP